MIPELKRHENKPFYYNFDTPYNDAIFNLRVHLKSRMYALERFRRDREYRRKNKEPVQFNKPKSKHLAKTWETIRSCEKFFEFYYFERVKDEASTTPLVV